MAGEVGFADRRCAGGDTVSYSFLVTNTVTATDPDAPRELERDVRHGSLTGHH